MSEPSASEPPVRYKPWHPVTSFVTGCAILNFLVCTIWNPHEPGILPGLTGVVMAFTALRIGPWKRVPETGPE